MKYMGVYEGLKDAAKVLQEAGKIEQYRQILEVLEKMLEMQKRISDLDQENKGLKEKLEIQGALTFENNAYWAQVDAKKDGPFCSKCCDAERKKIRTHPCGDPAYHTCPNCKTTVKIGHDRNSSY